MTVRAVQLRLGSTFSLLVAHISGEKDRKNGSKKILSFECNWTKIYTMEFRSDLILL